MAEPERDPTVIPEELRERPKGAPVKKDPDAGMWGMAKAWGTALDFIFTIVAGAALGWGFDRWQGTEPKGMMGGLAVGFVVAFIRIVRSTLRQERLEQQKRRKP
ncbi:MAG: AtpZ/AtpI family protein [Phycisphaerales bacterium]